MDIADEADKQIEHSLRTALHHFHSRKNPAILNSCYSISCTECGTPIPVERQKILPGCGLCVDCANFFEQADRLCGKNIGTWWWD